MGGALPSASGHRFSLLLVSFFLVHPSPDSTTDGLILQRACEVPGPLGLEKEMRWSLGFCQVRLSQLSAQRDGRLAPGRPCFLGCCHVAVGMIPSVRTSRALVTRELRPIGSCLLNHVWLSGIRGRSHLLHRLEKQRLGSVMSQ